MTEGRTDATLFRKLYLVPNAFGYTVPAKRNGGFIACKGDGDFVGTGLKTAIIARRFPRSFKQSIALLLKSKFGDQNVSEHESILSDQEQIGSTNGKPNRERYTRGLIRRGSRAMRWCARYPHTQNKRMAEVASAVRRTRCELQEDGDACA